MKAQYSWVLYSFGIRETGKRKGAMGKPALTELWGHAGFGHNKLKHGRLYVLKHNLFGWISSEGEIKRPAQNEDGWWRKGGEKNIYA